ncbi:hypothetical protein COO60DRAFT_570958 [Scenedesmus sp. NREL 46B-D3]|nr:hypothetical protein COO60DRAFT_570958 [Scenedesmus sp. NREL 46B-D3]
MFGCLRPCCRNACLHGNPLGAPGELGRGSPGPALLEVRSCTSTWSPGAVYNSFYHMHAGHCSAATQLAYYACVKGRTSDESNKKTLMQPSMAISSVGTRRHQGVPAGTRPAAHASSRNALAASDQRLPAVLPPTFVSSAGAAIHTCMHLLLFCCAVLLCMVRAHETWPPPCTSNDEDAATFTAAVIGFHAGGWVGCQCTAC